MERGEKYTNINKTEDVRKMFGPLAFTESNNSGLFEDEYLIEITCLLCDDSFNLAVSFGIFVGHLFDAHNLIIEDVQNIHRLAEYVKYWKDRFKETPIESVIPCVKITGTNLRYFVLSTLTKDDANVRHKLRLEHVLSVQERERSDSNFRRQCLFCRLQYEGTRHGFLRHLSQQHNLQLGNCENLVFTEELIDKIEGVLNRLQCIYCEKTFPDRTVLKEHMRKKLHKRVNPQNKEYDRYYVVNYLEPGKTWRAIEREDDRFAVSCGEVVNPDEDYSDWNEKEDAITCLFCVQKRLGLKKLYWHMEEEHSFDFPQLTVQLNFYQKIKLVNYIRRQAHENRCFYCDFKCENASSLERHMHNENHHLLPEHRAFDQPEFYFPTYENDAFLYLMEDDENDEEGAVAGC